MYKYVPGDASATLVGALSVPGHTDTRDLEGGDLAFDGLGNMTAVFKPNYGTGTTAPSPFMAVFPGTYSAGGAYTGVTLNGQTILDLIISPTGIGFLPSGDLIVGSSDNSGSFIKVNTNTGSQEVLSTNFASSDIASCAAPAPNISITKAAETSCTTTGTTVKYTIIVQNTGVYHAFNTTLVDNLPAALTLQSVTLNGTAISGVTKAALAAGLQVKSTNAITNGQVFKNETATIVLTCTTTSATTDFSNQAFVKYTGWNQTTFPNGIPSDNPSTATPNDPTVVTTCATLSGKVYNDPNGQTNGVDGTVLANVTVTLYAADGTTVIATTTTNASGDYIFYVPNVPADYVVKVTPPNGYQNSSSTDTTPLDGTTNVAFPGTSTSGINFGVEMPPESYDVTKEIVGAPVNGTSYSLAATADQLRGSDPTDQPSEGTWSGKSLLITSLPTNGFVLIYDGHEITSADIGTNGYLIPNYNPSLLSIKAATVAGGVKTTSFQYATIDAAGVRDLSPATYTVNFSEGLPVTFGLITAKIKDETIYVNWQSLTETNNDHYKVEISANGIDFIEIGKVDSKAVNGNSGSTINYEFSANTTGKLLGGMALAAFVMSIMYRRRRWLSATLMVVFLSTAIVACNKNSNDLQTPVGKNAYIRLVQVDKDGGRAYSRIIKATVEE